MQNVPQVGKLIGADEVQYRDAIHVAVVPLIAGCSLSIGQAFEVRDGLAIPAWIGEGIGIVDPYLMRSVVKGERFWGFMYPGTVQNLRHAWSHPAFAAKLPTQKEDGV